MLALIVVVGLGLLSLKFNSSRNLEVSLRQGDVFEIIYGQGTVVSDQVYHVRTGIGISLQNVFVEEGQSVVPGTKLAICLMDVQYNSPILSFNENIRTCARENISGLTKLECLVGRLYANSPIKLEEVCDKARQ